MLLKWVDLQPEHFYNEGLDEFKKFVKTTILVTEGAKAKPLWKKISKTQINAEVLHLAAKCFTVITTNVRYLR